MFVFNHFTPSKAPKVHNMVTGSEINREEETALKEKAKDG